MKGKVLLGMSGGVDSTYAAHVLKEAGYAVEGAVLAMHQYTELDEAIDSARSIGIPIRVLDARERFSKIVIEDFCRAYQNAMTPNPCIICNENVKFRILYEEAVKNGFDKIATGHYARVSERNGHHAVEMARDISKDQSYMLYRLPENILSRLILPLGDRIKTEVTASAAAMALSAAMRPESQEICFVKEESYIDFIKRTRGPLRKGCFVDESGMVLGEHNGIQCYTVGQRKGLGISAATRLFVKEIHPETGDIVLSDSAPLSSEFLVSNMVFSGMDEEEALVAEELRVKVRYQAAPVAARLTREANGAFRVSVAERIRFVTPGQSAVLYHGERVVCGGIIQRALGE